MEMKDIIKDKLILRRLIIISIWLLISAAYAPFLSKVRGTYLEYILLTSTSIIFAFSGIIQDYIKNIFSSVTVRNIVIVCNIIDFILILVIYNKFHYITTNDIPLTDHEVNKLIAYIILEVMVIAVEIIMTGILGSRMKGYLGSLYRDKCEAIDFKEKKLISTMSIFGLVIFGTLYKVLGAGPTLIIGGILTLLSNLYDISNTKVLVELDKKMNRVK